MLKIAIEESDALYRNGLEVLLNNIFEEEKNERIKIENLSVTNITSADIIIKRYVAGVSLICQPLLKKRIVNNLIIGLYEGDNPSENEPLPLCISNIVFIDRAASVAKTKELIIQGWERCNSFPRIYNHMSCFSCRHRTLTSQQMVVAAHFYRGHNPQQTASILNINHKTVAAHKRKMMANFNLDTDYELLNFLNVLLKDKYASESFKYMFNAKLEQLL